MADDCAMSTILSSMAPLSRDNRPIISPMVKKATAHIAASYGVFRSNCGRGTPQQSWRGMQGAAAHQHCFPVFNTRSQSVLDFM